MTMHTIIHQPVKVEACKIRGTDVAYLDLQDGSGGVISVHMPYDKAKAMADAFNAAPPASFATSA